MELVYLWVEEYKNIHKQGFNFSPRFECNYDGKELTIKENDDYIENFFGENINVTAIVGKNGSGKSSVLECLSDNPKFIVIFKNDEFYISENIKIENNTNYNNIHINISLDCIYISSPDYLYRNLDQLLTNRGLENNTLNNLIKGKGEELSFTTYFDIVDRYLDMLFLAKELSLFKYPHHIVLLYMPEESLISYHKLFKLESLKKMSLSDIVYIRAFELLYEKNIISSRYFNNKDVVSLKELFFNVKDIISDSKALEYFNEVKSFCTLFSKYDKIYTDEKYIPLNDIDIIFKIPFSEFNFKIINKFLKKFFDYELDTKFSSGENTILDLCSTIFYELRRNEKLIYIFIDEGESFLHPNWQKKYISYIIQFIKDNFPNRKIHIILTSHSPFLLSDIPKQNIIFLDKDENGNCKVLTHNEVLNKKQTFGANIHTLLSDSFFMENGLMGEFAKSKINEIIDSHKEVEEKNSNKEVLKTKYLKNQKKFWQTQKIIGEEYLKQVIKNHLVEIEKKLLGKDRAKQEEIKRVEAYLESLKK